MQFKDFVRDTEKYWNGYLRSLSQVQARGGLVLRTPDGRILPTELLYPHMLIVTATEGYYIAELIGATSNFEKLTVKNHKEKSIYRYINQFDDAKEQPLLAFDAIGQVVGTMCLGPRGVDLQAVYQRFPYLVEYGTKLINANGPVLFGFTDNFRTCAIKDCMLINQRENIYRCKKILELIIVNEDVTSRELQDSLKHFTSGQVTAVHSASVQGKKVMEVGGQLQSMYLFPKLHETTIGEYLRVHSEVVETAFNAEKFLYEPFLEWKEVGKAAGDKAINPDIILQRSDGQCDILDLKTAAPQKKSIVKGGRRRRRFIDYVDEGAAQLAHYREYFLYESNRNYARKKYGIDVQSPSLFLIVGSWENASKQEIEEASRRYHDISIIDYDTFAHSFYLSKAVDY